jgi:hypothetical protein
VRIRSLFASILHRIGKASLGHTKAVIAYSNENLASVIEGRRYVDELGLSGNRVVNDVAHGGLKGIASISKPFDNASHIRLYLFKLIINRHFIPP